MKLPGRQERDNHTVRWGLITAGAIGLVAAGAYAGRELYRRGAFEGLRERAERALGMVGIGGLQPSAEAGASPAGQYETGIGSLPTEPGQPAGGAERPAGS